MKVQIHRTIRAHLLRVAFYLLLLLPACAIPFALAQRNLATRSKAKASPASEFLTTSNAAASPAITVSVIPPIPAAPAIALYDQVNNPAPTPPPPRPVGSSHRRTTSPNSTIKTASLLTISSCQRARFGISLKWMSSANPANPPFRRIRSMFSSTQIAARCQRRWLQAGSPTHTADSLLL
jgi:hypothetical protein